MTNVFGVFLVLLLLLVISSFRILKEYERGVIYTLGKYSSTREPGIQLVVPFVQELFRVDVRIRTVDIPTQDVISRDNVSVRVNAVVYFRVMDSQRAVIQVEDFMMATSQLAQTTLRSVLGQHDLDDMLAARDKLNADIQRILDDQTDAWGIKVSNVELKHVDIEESMIRAIARQAEAERSRRAKIIDAEGEFQAAVNFVKAAGMLSKHKEAMQLRYLNTLHAIATDKASLIVFPFPMDFGELLRTMGGRGTALDGGTPDEPDLPEPPDLPEAPETPEMPDVGVTGPGQR